MGLDPTPAAPVVTPSTPWYRNPVVWSTYLIHAIGIFLIISPLIASYPGVPAGLVTLIGAITIALNQLGYQAHSAKVRAAELAVTPQLTGLNLAPILGRAPASPPALPEPNTTPASI